MRYAIIGDIHSNYEALTAVLRDIDRKNVNQIICAGDVVGYGPNPGECIDELMKRNIVTVAGNHDAGTAKQIDWTWWRIEARETWEHAIRTLSTTQMNWLRTLPRTLTIKNMTIVHGSPTEPLYEYIYTPYQCIHNVPYFNGNICFTSHTHVPLAIRFRNAKWEMIHFETKYGDRNRIFVANNDILFANPGSVGQPRDGNPKASYMIYDNVANQIFNNRVVYDVQWTQDKIRKLMFDPLLSNRLTNGC